MPKDELTVEPYTGALRTGEPAYTYMGLQVLKSVIDEMPDSRLLAYAKRYDVSIVKPDRNIYAQIAVERALRQLTDHGDLK